MIKGPVIPILVVLTLITLAIWERRNGWMKHLVNWPAILVFALIWIPWTIAIWNATDGAFFVESLGKDFGGKLVSAQERHPGPPGYYLGTIWLTLWPTCLLLLPAFGFAIRAVKNGKGSDAPVVKGMRLCLAWVVPYWVLIELMPTKLPHYALPLFPALCVMAGVAAITLLAVKEFSVLRRINAVLFLAVSAVLIAVVMGAQTLYGETGTAAFIIYAIGGIAGLCAVIASFALWQSNMKLGLITAMLAALIISVPTYAYILPNLTALRVADNITKTFDTEGLKLPRNGGPDVVSPHFTEPSLVYRLGTAIDVTDKSNLLDMRAFAEGRVIILDVAREDTDALIQEIEQSARIAGLCTKTTPPQKGLNYSTWDEVAMVIMRSTACKYDPNDPLQRDE